MIRACGCQSFVASLDGAITVEVCHLHRADMEEFLAERALFEALLAAGVDRAEANRLMIDRIEKRRL